MSKFSKVCFVLVCTSLAGLACASEVESQQATSQPGTVITICPVGGGACQVYPAPASSYTNARAVPWK